MISANRVAAVALALALGVAGTDAQDRKAEDKPVADAEFVIKAASGGMFEVESSKIAKDAAKAEEVKKFAEMMITDHEKANKELMDVAKKANLGLPLKMLDEHQKMLEKVKGAKGSDFDKTYMETQVAAHEEAVALFSNAAKNVKEANLRAFAEKTLPVIKEHHEHAKKHAKGGDK
jgi:putative membrane protein